MDNFRDKKLVDPFSIDFWISTLLGWLDIFKGFEMLQIFFADFANVVVMIFDWLHLLPYIEGYWTTLSDCSPNQEVEENCLQGPAKLERLEAPNPAWILD